MNKEIAILSLFGYGVEINYRRAELSRKKLQWYKPELANPYLVIAYGKTTVVIRFLLAL